MGDHLGSPGAACMGSDIDAAQRQMDSVQSCPLLVQVCYAGVHLWKSVSNHCDQCQLGEKKGFSWLEAETQQGAISV